MVGVERIIIAETVVGVSKDESRLRSYVETALLKSLPTDRSWSVPYVCIERLIVVSDATWKSGSILLPPVPEIQSSSAYQGQEYPIGGKVRTPSVEKDIVENANGNR